MLGVYERQPRSACLRDVFVLRLRAVLPQQYVAVKAEPGAIPERIFRLPASTSAGGGDCSYRAVSRDAPTEQAVTSRMPALASRLRRPTTRILCNWRWPSLALTVHAGNAVRFGIRPLEFGRERRAQDMKQG